MLRLFFSFCFVLILSPSLFAQTREELEKQRQQLKREMDETQKLLSTKNAQAKSSISTQKLVENKMNLQTRVMENITKDLNILDNNIYSIQKDINRYDRLLDTLKQEYAKSMVYSYKNRGNYEFLNFIFSADNFNDAIKRVTYLKSYRTYREMQGQNILRTQELRRKRLEDIGVTKQKKNTTLDLQSKEKDVLEEQKAQQDKIVAALKKDVKSLNESMASKKRLAAKVNGLIASAIKEALAAARRESIAKKAAEDKRLKDARDAEAKRLAAEIKKNPGKANDVAVVAPAVKVPSKKTTIPESVLLNSENIKLNERFEGNRGSLPWPVDNGSVIMHFGPNKLPGGGNYDVVSTTIASAIGTPIKSIFDGVVSIVSDDVIVLQHGRYFTTYINVQSVTVKKGDVIKYGQTLGRVGLNDDGIGATEIQISDEHKNFDPEKWMRHR